MTTSAFPALTTAETIFQDLVWNPLLKAGEAALDTAQVGIPVLDIPLVEGVEDDVIQAVANALFARLAMVIDIESIALVDSVRQSQYEAASEALVLASQSQGVTSDAYKTALATALKDFSAFGKLGS